MGSDREGTRRINKTICFVIGSGALLLLAMAFQWDLIDLLISFLWIPLLGLLYIFFAVSGIWSIAYAVRYRKKGAAAFIPLLLTGVVCLAIHYIPFTQIWIDVNFHTKRTAREQVVQKVLSGHLSPNVPHNQKLIKLPGEPGLSKGGDEIVVQGFDGDRYVFFYTFRGILDNYSGFLWVPPNGTPQTYSDADEPGTEIKKINENWYFVGHH